MTKIITELTCLLLSTGIAVAEELPSVEELAKRGEESTLRYELGNDARSITKTVIDSAEWDGNISSIGLYFKHFNDGYVSIMDADVDEQLTRGDTLMVELRRKEIEGKDTLDVRYNLLYTPPQNIKSVRTSYLIRRTIESRYGAQTAQPTDPLRRGVNVLDEVLSRIGVVQEANENRKSFLMEKDPKNYAPNDK